MNETGMMPAKPRKLRTVVVREGGRLYLRCRNRQWGTGLFLLLWLTAWTVGCVVLAVQAITKRQAFMFLFGIPFWSSWVFVFFIVLKAFFQVEEMTLDAGGVQFLRRVIVGIRSRKIPLEELKKVVRYSLVVDSESGRVEAGLELETSGRPLRMMQGARDEELRWLEYQINEQIGVLRGRTGMASAPAVSALAEGLAAVAGAGDAGEADDPSDGDDASLLILSTAATGPPADSRWGLAESGGELVFLRRGRLELGGIGGLIFVNLFWNGIVSVFVMHLFGGPIGGKAIVPQGIGWWGLFVFLIPFELIGLAMFAGLLFAMGEPFHWTRWRFNADGMACRNTWLGLGPNRAWAVQRLARLDLRRENGRQTGGWSFRPAGQVADTTYRIVFVTPELRELCSIKGLTEGEARWMAQAILRHCAGWFG